VTRNNDENKHKLFTYRGTNHSPLRAEYTSASVQEELQASQADLKVHQNYLTQSSYLKESQKEELY